jgi:long-chain acyl-CoA synthetase
VFSIGNKITISDGEGASARAQPHGDWAGAECRRWRDTFPKLLIRVPKFTGAPARHKDLGIWQTWTWSQVLDIVRAYAVGLHRLGLKRGETPIVGGNRPKLYWSVMAAQMLLDSCAGLCRAVADELAYVLAHADVASPRSRIRAGRQDSRSRSASRSSVVYDEKRGFETRS